MEAMEASFLSVFFQAANKIANLTESKMFFLMETSDGVHKVGGNAQLKVLFQTGQLIPKNTDIIINDEGEEEEEEENRYQAPSVPTFPDSHDLSRALSSNAPFDAASSSPYSAASSSSASAASSSKSCRRDRIVTPASKRKSTENYSDGSSSKKRENRKNYEIDYNEDDNNEEDNNNEEVEEEPDEAPEGTPMMVKVEEGEDKGEDPGTCSDLDFTDDEHDKSHGAVGTTTGEPNPDASNKYRSSIKQPWPRLSKFYDCLGSTHPNNYVFACLLCKPKLRMIKNHKSSLSNLRSHMRRCHTEDDYSSFQEAALRLRPNPRRDDSYIWVRVPKVGEEAKNV